MRPSPLLSAAAATALLAALSGPALAGTTAPTAVPAKGVGSSSLTLLGITAGGHSLTAGTLELLSDAMQAQGAATVVLTPLTADGTAIGRQTVTPSSSPGSTPSVSSSSLVPALAGLLSVRSPVLSATASDGADGPSSSAGATSLGGLSLLGLPVDLAGTLAAGSGVTSAGAVGDKTVSVTDLALPSIADLLGALGLDLTALPYGVLEELVTKLDLVNGAVGTASSAVRTATAALQTQIAAAQARIDSASAAVVTRTTELTGARSQLAATDAFTTSTTSLATAQGLADVAGVLVTTLTSTVATLTSALATLQAALNAALASLDGVLAGVQPLINTLVGAITAVLDGTPLVSLDSFEVLTQSKVTSAVAGGQTAKIVGGELVGLNVLGTDVLADVLGSSKVDLLDLTGSTLAQVNGAIDGLTGTLSEVLSTVPGFPTLSLPAPAVELLSTQSLTGISGGFGTASTAVKALSITLPAIALPSALALPGAATLPAFTALPALPVGALPVGALRANLGLDTVTGLLTSSPVRIDLATLTDAARFAPAVAAATPGTATPGTAAPGTAAPGTAVPGTVPGIVAPQLPRTGAGQALALLGTVLLGLAVAARRRAQAVA